MKLQKLTKAWFSLPDDPDEASFEIKHLRAGEIAEIVEKTYKQRFEFREDKTGELKPVPVIESNKMAERELTVVATISEWKNIYDENGETLTCTDENKLRLCKELSEEDFKFFLDFLTDSRQKLAGTVKTESEKEKKT